MDHGREKNKVEALEVLCITKIVSSFFYYYYFVYNMGSTNWNAVREGNKLGDNTIFFIKYIYVCARTRFYFLELDNKIFF